MKHWLIEFSRLTQLYERIGPLKPGNLTILGSVTNVIVVESARGHAEVGFWDYARFGIPVAILTTMAGMVILLLIH